MGKLRHIFRSWLLPLYICMSTQFLGLLHTTGLLAHTDIASANLTSIFVVQLIGRPKTVLVDFEL